VRFGLALAACVCAAGIGAAPALAQSGGWFEERPFADRSWTLDDLGVVDYDQDGNLDVFTTNHLSTQLLLRGDGTGSFEDRLTDAGLNQTADFPGWEDDPNVPKLEQPGLYVYRQSGVTLRRVGGAGTVTGTLRFLAPVTVLEARGAQATVTPDDGQSPPRNVARFSMSGDSILRLKPESAALPVDVSIDPPFPLDDVFVGRREVAPSSRGFTLYIRDRHGMAWADYNRDGHLDVFITRGGVSGNIDRYRGVIQDELLLGDGSGFRAMTNANGITKRTCRGRAARAIDYNDDGLIDVFADCSDQAPKLFRQLPNGNFRNVSRGMRRADIKGSGITWLDVDGRGTDELIVARKRRFIVYSRRNSKWKPAQKVRSRHKVNVQRLAVADYDNDGDPDVFAVSRSGSTLLENRRRGDLTKRNPRAVGLPTRALTANWVDYDNDGRLDLHLIPGGIYRQARGEFHRTELALPAGPTTRAIASWFDFDNDGSRDAVLAERHRDAGRFTTLRLLENIGPSGRWLELELEGEPGNRQAVGAKVRVKAGELEQTQWVGQNDGAHLSQGHYRLYFGLGAATGASVKITWPDGTVQRLGAVGVDRIVRVTQPG
jgi:hypothetical protein